jgi:hypothetical protein
MTESPGITLGARKEKNIRPNNQIVIPACFWRESTPAPCSLDSRLRGNDDQGSTPNDYLLPGTLSEQQWG